jgi:hypothetical protein
VTIAPDAQPDEPVALKRIITTMPHDAVVTQAEVARLKFQLTRYRRAEFGSSSEKLARAAAQLERTIETLESDQAERQKTSSNGTSHQVRGRLSSENAIAQTDSTPTIAMASTTHHRSSRT